MAFDSFGEFLAMGNHGFYVWFAYGLTFIVLGGLAWQSLAALSQTRRELAAQRLRAAAAGSTGGSIIDSGAEPTTATENTER